MNLAILPPSSLQLHRNLLLPISHVNENVNPKSKGQKRTPKPRISLPVPPVVESECSSSDESFDDAIIEVVVPQLGPEVQPPLVPVSPPISVHSDDMESRSMSSTESVHSDPEESIEQAPIPAPRRSLRNRKRPVWMDSGQWVQSQLVDQASGDGLEKAKFLLEIASKYSHLPESVLLKIISMV